MSTTLVAKRFRCDICGAEAVVDDPDTGKIPDQWADMSTELLMHGYRVRDFCGTCLLKPFGQVVTEIMANYNAAVERRKAERDGDRD